MGHFRSIRGEPIPLRKRTRFFKMTRSLLVFLVVVGAIIAAGWFIEMDRRAPAGRR